MGQKLKEGHVCMNLWNIPREFNGQPNWPIILRITIELLPTNKEAKCCLHRYHRMELTY